MKVVDHKKMIIDASVKYQVLSKYTSFLCVEKELVDGRYQEVKGKGQERVFLQQEG